MTSNRLSFRSFEFELLPWIRASAAVVAMTVTAQSGVVVVDAAMGPGADYADLFVALDWVAPNDVIVIRPGDYTASAMGYFPTPVYIPFGLTIVAESPSSPPKLSIVLIENLPANERVVFRGIDFLASPMSSGCSENQNQRGLQVSNCAGSVLVEDCRFFGGRPAIAVNQSADVTLSRCAVFPSSYVFDCFAAKTSPGRALEIQDANVTLQSCEIHGGDGADASPAAHTPGIEGAKPGGTAIYVDGGNLFLGKTLVAGGAGGDGTFDGFGNCYKGAIGGIGLQLTANGGLVRTLDSTIAAGVSGNSAGSCAPPATAAATDLIAGALVSQSGESNTLVGPPTALEGSSASISVEAPSGHSVLALASASFGSSHQPAGSSVLHVGLPVVLVPFGVVPPSGTISVATTIPSVVPSNSAIQIFIQAANVSPMSGIWRLGSPSVAVIVDP